MAKKQVVLDEMGNPPPPQPAFIWWYGRKLGKQQHATMRAGRDGQGKVIQVVSYYPENIASVIEAQRLFDEVAEQQGYTVRGSDHKTKRYDHTGALVAEG